MNWFTKIFSGGVKEVSDSVFGGLDNLFTSDEQRLKAEAIIPRIKANLEVELTKMENTLETYMQGELTKRHSADMQSDSWLSKNIRPIALGVISVGVSIVLGVSYGGWVPDPTLVTAIVDAWLLILMFYFGGRSAEKGIKMLASVLKKKGV